MERLFRNIILVLALTVAFTTSAQKTEYIIKEIKGNIEYRLKQGEDWKQAKRLLTLPKSALIKVGDDAVMTIYSQSNPQTLKINTPGENRLRTLIDQAEKKAAQSRGGELAHVLKGHGEQSQTVRSGTSYRGAADVSGLEAIAAAVGAASTGKAPIGLVLTKVSEGDYAVELSNSGEMPLVCAVLVNVAGRYTALNISDDPASTTTIVLPPGTQFTVPECTLAEIPGMQAIAVGAGESFDAGTLCTVLNRPAGDERSATGYDGLFAVKATIN